MSSENETRNNMKRVILVVCCCILANVAMSQNYVIKPNGAQKGVKEDSQNLYNLDNISTFDLLCALEMQDIRLFKVKLPKTDRERYLGIVVDKYATSKLIESDTTWLGKNTYHYWERGDTVVYKDYLEEITLFTKQNERDSSVMVKFRTYSMTYGIPIKYEPKSKDTFYNVRLFKPADLKYGEKSPMIAIASSWYDEKCGYDRFCGASILSMGEAETKELLNMSPNYYIISYIIE